jgi:hypothetical protein
MPRSFHCERKNPHNSFTAPRLIPEHRDTLTRLARFLPLRAKREGALMQKKFKGELATPIKPRQVGLLIDEAEIHEQTAKWAEEDHRKLLLLCQHYAIPEGPRMFYQLALSLARDFVDGFKERKPRGRKSKWTIWNKGALVVEIERLTKPKDSAHGVAWAAKQLAKREPWKSFIEAKDSGELTPDPAEALRQAYYDFKDDRWVVVARKAFELHQHENTISEWENFVADVVNNPHPK